MRVDSDAELKLYHGRASTCSKKVRMVLYEKQLPFTSCLLDLQKFEHLTPAYLKLNPNGVVPTLVHRGRPVIESNVMIEYLDETFPQMSLVPVDPYERARMRVITRFADTFAYNAVYVLSWMRLSAPAARQLSAEQLQAVLRYQRKRGGLDGAPSRVRAKRQPRAPNAGIISV
jgi:ganglioside-induced differentiation-associated protein 1